MSELDEKAQYELEFVARVKAARMATGMKQWQVAELMGITQPHYKHFEVDRTIPLYLIGRFCLVCHVDPEWLITGHGRKPLKPTRIVPSDPENPPAKTRQSRSKRVA